MNRRLRRRLFRSKRGYALMSVFGVMALLSVGAGMYVNRATQTIRLANNQKTDIQATHLCEAGIQSLLRSHWRPFKTTQNFTALDAACTGASTGNPLSTMTGSVPNIGRFSAGVIGYSQPDSYTRMVTVRCVSWIDRDNDALLDSDEARKTVDVTSRFALVRSQVFDYTYFVNNYGWMDGFSESQLIVNGDMRANGNFNFLNGSPTVNGSVLASINEKLDPPAPGLVNTPPVKWATNTYNTNWSNAGTVFRERWRQPYDSTRHGAKGSTQYENWRDFVFESSGSVLNGRTDGAIVGDSTGYDSWVRTSAGNTATTTVLDTQPTEEVIMPDLSNLAYYQNLSQTYVDQKATFGDGSANPGYGQGAWLDVWNQSLNGGLGAYQRITTNGKVTGSAVIVGTASKPIRIHGPVTFSEDCVIKGYVAGQGTVYTGRNVHIVGSIRYSDQNAFGTSVGTPDFQGSNPQTIDNTNEKRALVGLASRGSVIMGNTTQFTASYPLYYMRPPFTRGRYDDNGNYIPAYDCMQVDYTGKYRYQSTINDATMNSIAESVNVMDCVMYTNFVGGGNIGTGGGGASFNGTIISKDEAMVVFSLPMRMNYDHRIRERSLSQAPLIDIMLPRSPTLLRSTWQDRGFAMHAGGN